jgi:predicted O-methyltransferase YrrM
MVGGGFGPEYSHYWADDLLNYAVLDQGLDILHFDPKFRRSPYFAEFHYENLDVIDRRRHEDSLRYTGMFLDVIGLMDCGMTVDESVFLHLLAKSLPDASVLTNIGVYLGSSVITLLDAMRSKRATFFFVDCFDLPGSELPAQPPVTQDEFLRNIQPYIGKHHTVHVLKTDTLKMDSFPKSDLIFVDAAHTKKYVEHDAKLAHDCLNINGIAVFHDYHQPAWPDVTTVLDERFAESNLEVYRTMAVYRHTRTTREAYQWPNRR